MRCRDIALRLGIKADRLRVQLFWDGSDAAKVSSFLKNIGTAKGFFVIHPFARWKYKYWDIDRFVELSDLVSGTYGLNPVWTSSPEPKEVEILYRAAARCKVTPSLVPGTFSLNQIACLLDKASLYIGLDTAISHIAAAAGIPMVALYGSTDIWGWHPWDNNSQLEIVPENHRGDVISGNIVALQAACAYSHCIRPKCYTDGRENPCMMDIGVEDVFRAVSRLLESK
jgi:heptosyltransferase-3